jgi:hypothetical protein
VVTKQWKSRVATSIAVGVGMLLSLTAGHADGADDIGVRCARAKLRAVEKATGSLLKCYAGARAFGTVEPSCSDRARARMEQQFAVAERHECFGFQDDAAQAWTLVEGYATDVVRNLAPPAGCHVAGDGLMCGGQCPSGYTCAALGEQCGCRLDALLCDATAIAPILCPKIGQTCVDRTCTDPATGYCREEPVGSGQATGFCPSESTCLAVPTGDGSSVGCMPRLFACEDPMGVCTTSGTVFGFCMDAGKSCGRDCRCS